VDFCIFPKILVGLQKNLSRTPLMDAQLALRLFEMIRIGQANLAEAELRKLRSNAGTGPEIGNFTSSCLDLIVRYGEVLGEKKVEELMQALYDQGVDHKTSSFDNKNNKKMTHNNADSNVRSHVPRLSIKTLSWSNLFWHRVQFLTTLTKWGTPLSSMPFRDVTTLLWFSICSTREQMSI